MESETETRVDKALELVFLKGFIRFLGCGVYLQVLGRKRRNGKKTW